MSTSASDTEQLIDDTNNNKDPSYTPQLNQSDSENDIDDENIRVSAGKNEPKHRNGEDSYTSECPSVEGNNVPEAKVKGPIKINRRRDRLAIQLGIGTGIVKRRINRGTSVATRRPAGFNSGFNSHSHSHLNESPGFSCSPFHLHPATPPRGGTNPVEPGQGGSEPRLRRSSASDTNFSRKPGRSSSSHTQVLRDIAPCEVQEPGKPPLYIPGRNKCCVVPQKFVSLSLPRLNLHT
ncbi:hypothetical protein MTP99_005893 [Tenebrio molitor]|nr:hypothetical protein MTP99_005893 [Tenebrio molitor]